jgi:hypothetical protein
MTPLPSSRTLCRHCEHSEAIQQEKMHLFKPSGLPRRLRRLAMTRHSGLPRRLRFLAMTRVFWIAASASPTRNDGYVGFASAALRSQLKTCCNDGNPKGRHCEHSEAIQQEKNAFI